MRATTALAVLIAVLAAVTAIRSSAETDWVSAINDYTADLDSVAASFSQNSQGEVLGGHIYLNRGQKRLKVEYGDPNGRVIVADGGTLVHYDPKVQSFASYPLESTAAAVFLQQRLDTEPIDGFYINGIEERERILLVGVASPEQGGVELVFAKSPFGLLGWSLADGLGSSVTVRLGEIKPRKFSEDFFTLKDPRLKPF